MRSAAPGSLIRRLQVATRAAGLWFGVIGPLRGLGTLPLDGPCGEQAPAGSLDADPPPDPFADVGASGTGCSREVVTLVYELLDAHDDTVRLAARVREDLEWHTHLDYLRSLQRAGREALAHAQGGGG